MAGRSHTNWQLFLTLLSMGMRQVDAAALIGVKPATPYVKAYRDRAFGDKVGEALHHGRLALIASPTYFITPKGNMLLDGNFDPISREVPTRLRPWVLDQLARCPLTDLVR